jgi:hypothetical protein
MLEAEHELVTKVGSTQSLLSRYALDQSIADKVSLVRSS